jgi:hypothetical protein
MKTLANCTPVEFLKQTNKIRHSVGDLFEKAGIQAIRKRKPEFTGEETAEEKKELLRKQAFENTSAILDALMEENAEKTAEVLAMMCFVEPEEMDNYAGVDFVKPAIELFANKAVTDFLLQLAKLA